MMALLWKSNMPAVTKCLSPYMCIARGGATATIRIHYQSLDTIILTSQAIECELS